jgi:microcystin-dependent protein
MVAYAAATAPAGWLNCDGSAVSRTTYADLFAVTSTTYGVGNGTTTFNLPDLRGRIPVGLDNMGGTDAGRLSVANTLGGTGGTETHTLTSAQIPAHSHGNTLSNATVAALTHSHAEGNLAAAVGAANGNAGLIGYEAGSVRPSGRGPAAITNYILGPVAVYNGAFGNLTMNHYTRVYGDTSNNTTSVTVGITNANNTGGGGAHENMQPYILTYYIIKT